MPITVKDVADVFGKDVFTAKGFYAGKVSDIDIDLARFKIKALVIEASRGSFLGKVVGGKKGVIIPYPMVQAIADVVIIKHVLAPAEEAEAASQTESAMENV